MKINIGPYQESEEHDPNFERQVEIEIDYYDTWNMDNTLALIILPMLKQLKETKHGVPCCMPAYDDDQYGDSEKTLEKASEQWNEIMDKMIWSFEQLCSDDWGESQFWIEKPKLRTKTVNGDTSVWKQAGNCDYEGLKAHNDRIQEGLDLFGKHFRSLWD